jgi:hypothetical protein
MTRPKILLLSTSLLVDRVFAHTDLIETLSEYGEPVIWAMSRGDADNAGVWKNVRARVETFPKVEHFREFPFNYMRRLNEFVWDYRQKIPSRLSAQRHVREKNMPLAVRALKLPARLLAAVRAERRLEAEVEKMMLGVSRSPEAENRLRELNPAVVLVTGAFQFEQPAVFAAAKKCGIPTLAYIPSWDNITTKNRFVFRYDGFLVWSKQTRAELREFYPAIRDYPIYVTGAPQFDIFSREKFYQSREEFCREQGLAPDLPIIVYAIGSPNFLQEHHGAVELAKRIANGDLGKIQMLVRPHPIHDNAALADKFDRFAPQVRVQQTHNAGKQVAERSQDESQIREWINTFRHAAVVVNLASTVTIDAAIFDVPVVNLDFDPQPDSSHSSLIYDINHRWNHFKPIAESGAVRLVKNYGELVGAIKFYLENPTADRAARQRIVQYVCEHLDGRCASRMAHAVTDFAGLSKPSPELAQRFFQPPALQTKETSALSATGH